MGIYSGRGRIIQPVIFTLICLILMAGCAESGTTPEEVAENAQPYFGLEFPSSTATRFAPSIFREELHSAPVFTPDGREVYFSLMEDPRGVRYMKIEKGAWTDPAPAPFDSRGKGDSPFITSDGNHLLFLSSSGDIETIYQVDRVDGEWGTAQKLPDEINANGAHWQASMAENGNLYFSHARKVYFSELINGSYTTAVVLDLFAGSEDSYEGSPFIAPDESYLIFDYTQTRSSYADLFITFRNESGGWDEPIALEALNSNLHELYANVSPDGRFLMFLSNRSRGILLPYWVDTSLIESLRPQN